MFPKVDQTARVQPREIEEKAVNEAGGCPAEGYTDSDVAQWDAITAACISAAEDVGNLKQAAEPFLSIVKEQFHKSVLYVADVGAGCGRIAKGFAGDGHRVVAIDRSSVSAKHLTECSRRHALPIKAVVDDMRSLSSIPNAVFDSIVMAGNTVGLLLSPGELQACCSAIYQKLAPSGLAIVGMRDYDRLLKEGRTCDPPIFDGNEGNRRMRCSGWDFQADGRRYTAHFHMRHQVSGDWIFDNFVVNARAVLRNELTAALAEAGFTDISCIHNEDKGGWDLGSGCDELLISGRKIETSLRSLNSSLIQHSSKSTFARKLRKS